MVLFPEREPKKNVIERPDEASPLNIEKKEVATPVPTTFKAQVMGDDNKPIITTPQNQKVDITIPASGEEELLKDSKGSKEESLTWFANFWIRIFKKAVFLGRRIIFGKGDK